MSETNCIYCSRAFSPEKGQGDHVIPVQFGEFRHGRRFRGCCVECNNAIGKSEQQLIRCGPEAVMLRHLKPAVPSRRKRGFRSVVGALGAAPPKMMIPDGDFEVPVFHDTHLVGAVQTREGLRLKLKSGKAAFVELTPKMGGAALDRKLQAFVTDEIVGARWQVEKQNEEYYLALLKNARPNCTLSRLPDTPAGVSTVPVHTAVEVTTHYFRALAKVAFHYFLCYSPCQPNGKDPIFAGIRDFIMNGGKVPDFVVDRKLVLGPTLRLWLRRNLAPNGRCHLLMCADNPDNVTACVKMFHGDGCSIAYRIKLATVGASSNGSVNHAHAFVYENDQPKTGFAGAVHEILF